MMLQINATVDSYIQLMLGNYDDMVIFLGSRKNQEREYYPKTDFHYAFIRALYKEKERGEIELETQSMVPSVRSCI